MITAAIAFEEIERLRPDLMERIGLMLMKHPDPAPFWVAATDAANGKERARRMFIEGARWPDDSKGTTNDRLSWHTARFPIIAADASQKTKDLVASRGGRPVGDAIAALELQVSVMANPEAGADERALALSWFLHIAWRHSSATSRDRLLQRRLSHRKRGRGIVLRLGSDAGLSHAASRPVGQQFLALDGIGGYRPVRGGLRREVPTVQLSRN